MGGKSTSPEAIERERQAKRSYYLRKKNDPDYKRKAAEASSRWRASNPEKVRELNTRPRESWSKVNPEGARAAARRYDQKHKGKRRAQTADRRAKTKTNDPRVIALYEIAAWLREQGDDVHVDHIIPLSKGGRHTYENLQILTAAENLSKGNKTP